MKEDKIKLKKLWIDLKNTMLGAKSKKRKEITNHLHVPKRYVLKNPADKRITHIRVVAL